MLLEDWGGGGPLAARAVYALDAGRVRLRAVKVGERNATEAQVLEELAEGDAVVPYPSDRIRDGIRAAAR